MNQKDPRVCLGAFAGAHGVKGEALIKCFTEQASAIAAYGELQTEDKARRFSPTFIRETKPGLAIIRAPEITSREDALSLKGIRLYVDRSSLAATDEEDEFYINDLVGLAAFDETGAPAGFVRAVYNFGAGDLLELANVPGRKGLQLIAFTKETVPAISLAEGRISVAWAVIDDVDEGEASKN